MALGAHRAWAAEMAKKKSEIEIARFMVSEIRGDEMGWDEVKRCEERCIFIE